MGKRVHVKQSKKLSRIRNRRHNQKAMRRKTMRRKTMRRKTMRRKTMRRKTMRRKTMRGHKKYSSRKGGGIWGSAKSALGSIRTKKEHKADDYDHLATVKAAAERKREARDAAYEAAGAAADKGLPGPGYDSQLLPQRKR